MELHQHSGRGEGSFHTEAKDLINAASDIQCSLRRDEANALLKAVDQRWKVLRKLLLQFRGGSKKKVLRDDQLSHGSTLLEIVAAMKRVIARMHRNGQDFYQMCEEKDVRQRGKISKESLRQLCRDVGMALNSRELLILDKAFSSEDNMINYESMYRLIVPSLNARSSNPSILSRASRTASAAY